jgi:fatty acid desaturase
MPVWAYLVAAYVGTALLKIRTYLEHRAHEAARARTVIIESRGPFSLLFLNNNFHVVHHMHPAVAWYKLPAMYAARKEHYQRRNEAYVYPSYTEIFRRYLFAAKDPVPHPIWPVYKGAVASDDAAELGGGAGIVEERHAGLVPARH